MIFAIKIFIRLWFWFQLLTQLYIQFIIGNALQTTIRTFHAIFETDYPNFIRYVYALKHMQGTFFLLFTVIEICLFKYWNEFVRKKMLCMDEGFIVFFVTSTNIMISCLFGALKIIVGDAEDLAAMETLGSWEGYQKPPKIRYWTSTKRKKV